MSGRWLTAKMLVLTFGLGAAGVGLGQGAPFAGQVTPTRPFTMETFEIEEVLVTPVATGLANPFDMAFRGNGDILVTERYTGKLRVVRDGQLLESDLAGLPEVYSEVFRAGLMAVEVHPDDDSIVYLTYTKPIVVDGEPEQTVALVRARIVENVLMDVEEIFAARGLDRGIAASQLLFTPDGKLLMSIGGAYVYAGLGDYAQDPALHYGKLLRLNDDGSAPADNPFVEGGEYLPEVYSVGHRNIIGLSYHPETGELWATENGPQGGDEANIIRPGANYGWPIVSYSRQYRGDRVSERPWDASFADPEVIWWPSIAPASMIFYSGDKLPEWQGNMLVGSMMEGRIPGTGHIERVVFNSRGQEIRRESLLRQLNSRVTGVVQGPDGYLYVLLDEENGALLRLEGMQQD
ncbi:MAG: PQQ-dependent sugar dehydrogenase [Gammaproteobacteria bacterium]|nr:PQQ-dependent sugar dehydrogenase [Gammaproteobacteria bacterium]